MELLAPVGDFECLKAAVQNGADSVYFGGSLFNARMNSSNFDKDGLKIAIEYAKVRDVKTYLTLNTLVKDEEFDLATQMAKLAYELGIDGIIVQDLGIADFLIKNFPELPIHASTQMTIHNLEGAKQIEKLGFKRVVLSRELSISEIKHISENTNIETEVFIHGAMCMSYSGQCLISSAIGGRSGNRGKCAGTCRLPYQLLEDGKTARKGYLLSPKDLCGVENIPELIKAGVKCGKIEGRMKTPEYVATVTRIYRKYIDLAKDKTKKYIVEEQDKKDLLQIFNRGGNSLGHQGEEANKSFVFDEKPGNTGIYIGKVLSHNNSNGYIKIKLENLIELSDTIEIGDSKYNVSEIVENNNNVKEPRIGQLLELGRVKGDININDKVYKISSKKLTTSALESFASENKKINLDCSITIKHNNKITMRVSNGNLQVTYNSLVVPDMAKNAPISKGNIIKQLSKTGNTPFRMENINVDLDDNIFLANSAINDIRREALSLFENTLLENSKRHIDLKAEEVETETSIIKDKRIAVLLNKINTDYNYLELRNVDFLYIPFRYFLQDRYTQILKNICNNYKVYIYTPIIINEEYKELVQLSLESRLRSLSVHGIVISNLCGKELFENIIKKYNLEVIANYSMNIFNLHTIKCLEQLGFSRVTVSPELNLQAIEKISNTVLDMEQIVYGKQPVMTTKYCIIGNLNKCDKGCNMNCEKHIYSLKDRLNFTFPIIPNRLENTTTILNSKTTSVVPCSNIGTIRLDMQNESIDEIQDIINTYMNGNKKEGQEYTNGNANREV